ncbi:MAG: YigZ family protein [Clostridia bacterium]
MFWVVRPGLFRQIVKRSVFTGAVLGIEGPDDRARALALAARRVPAAGHLAFALRGREGEEQVSDAGEPAGTAGRPLLELIRRRNLEHAIIIVARQYGGINLGRPGLLRAYLSAGEGALSATGLEEPVPLLPIRLSLQYAQYEAFRHQFPDLAAEDSTVVFSDVVAVEGRARAADWPRLQAFAADHGDAVRLERGEPLLATRSPRSILEWPERPGHTGEHERGERV